MATVREILTAKIQRLRQKRQMAVDNAQSLQAEIDALVAERDGLTQNDEDRCARLQALGVIEAKD